MEKLKKQQVKTPPYKSMLVPFEDEILNAWINERKTLREIKILLENKSITISIQGISKFILSRRRRPDPHSWPEHLRPTANPPAPVPATAPAANDTMRPTTTTTPPANIPTAKPTAPAITPSPDTVMETDGQQSPSAQTIHQDNTPKSKEDLELEEKIRRTKEILRNSPTAAEWDIIQAEKKKKMSR